MMYEYQRKVQSGWTHLWGGPGIKRDLIPEVFLVCEVDEVGPAVDLQTIDQQSRPTDYGTLDKGQVYVLPLKGTTQVVAQTGMNRDSIVKCRLYCPNT